MQWLQYFLNAGACKKPKKQEKKKKKKIKHTSKGMMQKKNEQNLAAFCDLREYSFKGYSFFEE